MKKKRQSWYERYADRPVNLRQAELWRQQTQWAQEEEFPAFAETAAEPAGAAGNPWIDNLPRRSRRTHGSIIFLLLVAALVAVVGIYWGLYGLPEYAQTDSEAGRYENLQASEESVTIPRIGGGDTRLVVQEEHGDALSAQEIYQKVNPAVVTVLALQNNDSIAVGTGVLFTSDGFFLTNAHVIEDIGKWFGVKKPETVKISGGVAQEELLGQMIANVVGTKVEKPVSLEASAIGAAEFAGIYTGVYTLEDIPRLLSVEKVYEPNADAKKDIATYERWKQAIMRTTKWEF